jgi:CRP-like cAMP-binding protein
MARQHEVSASIKAPPGVLARSHPISEELARSRFFAEMTSEEIAGFIASTERRTFGEGEVVLEQGKEGRSLFILTRGVLRVETKGAAGGTLRMGVLTMGDVFGEVAFLTGRPRTATVIAETGAECLEIGSEAWTGILGKLPRVQKVLEDVHRERARFAADAILEDLRRRREDKGS